MTTLLEAQSFQRRQRVLDGLRLMNLQGRRMVGLVSNAVRGAVRIGFKVVVPRIKAMATFQIMQLPAIQR